MTTNEEQPRDDSQNLLKKTYFTTCSDVFQEMLKSRGLVEPLRRIILVGIVDYRERYDVRRTYELAMKNIHKSIVDVESSLTGTLIICENFFYHATESSDEILGDVIEATAHLVRDNSILGAKVIRSCGIVDRLFKEWSCCIVNTPLYSGENFKIENTGKESDMYAVAHLVKTLEDTIFVLASYIRYIKPSEFEEKINELVPTGVLPSTAELVQIYEESFFLTVEDYVSLYLVPQEYTSYLEEECPPSAPLQDAAKYFEEISDFEKDVESSIIEEEKREKRKKLMKRVIGKVGVVTAFQSS